MSPHKRKSKFLRFLGRLCGSNASELETISPETTPQLRTRSSELERTRNGLRQADSSVQSNSKDPAKPASFSVVNPTSPRCTENKGKQPALTRSLKKLLVREKKKDEWRIPRGRKPVMGMELVVVRSFCPVQFDELPLHVGDRVFVTSDAVNGGYWQGEIGGVVGYFPPDYTKVIKLPERQPYERSQAELSNTNFS
eukprot:comp20909_c0_seq1/m.27871 comp20909_c0_seq1/g.27871  ORF comp20909_c0_seq1/g.27871 comp20909_c0_seq1/m.27871 type:complete len:196 (-) comp20909_c0_seq1:447-1034(-)